MTNKTGILLINIGTPDSPTPEDVSKFLFEFLSDPLVVDYPRWLWNPILDNIILKTRPKKSAKLYEKIWGENGSPLLWITKSIAIKMGDKFPNHYIAVGMRYGKPSIEKALREMQDNGVTDLSIYPLFPQYSSTTTLTALKKTAELIDKKFEFDSVKTIEPYFNHPAYIEALAGSIKETFAKMGKPEKLLFSFHGVPKRLITRKGEKYQAQCNKTAELTAKVLGLSETDYIVSYQSRFGPEPWLMPYTDKVLQTLGTNGVNNVHIICPGFSADCLETLEEISIEYKKMFLEAGGENFHYIPALNDSQAHISALTQIIKDHLK